MALDPWYAVFKYDEYTEYLQREAISEIMTMTPAEKRFRLGTYGLTPPCRAVVNAVMRGMHNPLSYWASKNYVTFKSLPKPAFRPEAFRLESGCIVWPNPDHISLLMPLGKHMASVELIPRGTNYIIPAEWDSAHVLFLNEMGIRFTGRGSLRFIYIMIRKDSVRPVVQPFRVHKWRLRK
ncbi:hypothetical protein CEP54_008317 [Fusarium duplospermum]|uniref:Uncharacterized protein n=1 Tax=Fusarium duplospermum TaxID=1325734 RepID=A0A428PWI6_9HYPO|nr:hypothetical protein CEP54_008317 [Fusarium duplospermum]